MNLNNFQSYYQTYTFLRLFVCFIWLFSMEIIFSMLLLNVNINILIKALLFNILNIFIYIFKWNLMTIHPYIFSLSNINIRYIILFILLYFSQYSYGLIILNNHHINNIFYISYYNPIISLLYTIYYFKYNINLLKYNNINRRLLIINNISKLIFMLIIVWILNKIYLLHNYLPILNIFIFASLLLQWYIADLIIPVFYMDYEWVGPYLNDFFDLEVTRHFACSYMANNNFLFDLAHLIPLKQLKFDVQKFMNPELARNLTITPPALTGPTKATEIPSSAIKKPFENFYSKNKTVVSDSPATFDVKPDKLLEQFNFLVKYFSDFSVIRRAALYIWTFVPYKFREIINTNYSKIFGIKPSEERILLFDTYFELSHLAEAIASNLIKQSGLLDEKIVKESIEELVELWVVVDEYLVFYREKYEKNVKSLYRHELHDEIVSVLLFHLENSTLRLLKHYQLYLKNLNFSAAVVDKLKSLKYLGLENY